VIELEIERLIGAGKSGSFGAGRGRVGRNGLKAHG
jgi:hypothetical protein